jgi:hypothetical protein
MNCLTAPPRSSPPGIRALVLLPEVLKGKPSEIVWRMEELIEKGQHPRISNKRGERE